MPLKQHFDREHLKTIIGEENIFTHYFGNFDFGTGYNSVFREDQKSSTGFYVSKTGGIIYNDLATGDKYDFVHFVMKKFGLNYYAALKQIATDFGLLNGKPTNNTIAIIKPNQQPKKVYKKAFIINTTPFKKYHLDWWAQYGITLEELKLYKIYAVDSFTINKFDDHRNLVTTYTSPINNELKFVYTYRKDNEVYVKIYTPLSDKFKWFGDVPLTLPFGLDTLPYVSDTLIVTKSVKDCIVLRKYFTDVIGMQNESRETFDEELLAHLLTKYKNIYIWFDNDAPGEKAALYYKETYGFNTITTPNKTEKDPADFVKRYGLNVFEQYLKHIKLK